jgi:hypothetical protein
MLMVAELGCIMGGAGANSVAVRELRESSGDVIAARNKGWYCTRPGEWGRKGRPVCWNRGSIIYALRLQ